jgi:hypothetical protein
MSTERFARLFAGLDRAFGQSWPIHEVKPDDRGKIEALHRVNRMAPMSTHWLLHLEGAHRIGSFPLRDDGTVGFGCIDIDDYCIDHRKLAADIDALKLPLIACRSKSGGAHCFAFFRDAPADLAQRKLREWSVALGHPKAEIFPKQTRLRPDEFGNFVNLPYFAGHRSLNYAFKADGSAMPLDEFLDAAEGARIGVSELEELHIPAVTRSDTAPIDDDDYEGAGFENVDESHLWHEGKGPEHWQRIARGLGSGERHNGLMSLAGLLFATVEPTLADVLVKCFNRCQCSPPLPDREVRDIIRHCHQRECC